MTAIDRPALFDALARYLADAGLVRYSATGGYGPGALPAVFYRVRPDAPGDAVAITVYDENCDRDDANPDVYVQFAMRRAGTDPRPVDLFAAALHDCLHDQRHDMPGGISVKLARRKIAGMSDPDTSGRWTRPDSYIFTLDPKATP